MLPERRRGQGAAQQRGVQLMCGLQLSDPLASLLGTIAPAGHKSLAQLLCIGLLMSLTLLMSPRQLGCLQQAIPPQ